MTVYILHGWMEDLVFTVLFHYMGGMDTYQSSLLMPAVDGVCDRR